MKYKIDSTTNLPKLPDGYWWRVGRERYRNYDHVTSGMAYGWDADYPYLIAGFVYLLHNVEHTKRRWFRRITVTEEKAIYSQVVRTPYRSGTESIGGIERPTVGYDYEITPESITKAAESIMSRWEYAKAQEAKRQAEEKLLGNYPPKKLG